MQEAGDAGATARRHSRATSESATWRGSNLGGAAMTSEGEDEYTLHTKAIVAARKAAGLELPTKSPDDRWWLDGPHIE
jgi:hypothetical protein